MKLVIYDSDKKIIQVIENVNNPIVEENNVEWEDGSLQGINLPFLFLEDDVVLGEEVTNDVIALDQKEKYPKIDIKKENEELKAQIKSMQEALDYVIMNY